MFTIIAALWSTHKSWTKWVLAIVFIAIIYPLSLGLIKAIFGGDKDVVYVLPGVVKYLLILAFLIGGVVSGEKNNTASVILASAVAGVLFFFFTPTLTRWIGVVAGIIPAPLVAGIFLIGLAILAKKMLDIPKISTVLFIGGTAFIVLAIMPLVLSNSLKQLLLSASSILPTPKDSPNLPLPQKIGVMLVTFGLVKSVLVGACLLFWIKKPQSVTRLLISGVAIVGIYHYSDSKLDVFLANHHVTNKAIETQRTVGRNTLRRFIDRVTAGDRRSEVLSHKKIAKTGIFYLPKEASICEGIVGGVCKPATGITLNKDFTKVFIIEDGAKTVAGYSWELVALNSPTGKKVYAFAGDLVEDASLSSIKAAKEASIKRELLKKPLGCPNCFILDKTSVNPTDGTIGITITSEVVGKDLYLYNMSVDGTKWNGPVTPCRSTNFFVKVPSAGTMYVHPVEMPPPEVLWGFTKKST